VRNKPPYAIESVDNALRLALLLQQEGPMRGSEAAARLGVARSTAHRLLAMLVFRDFAQQEADRRYSAGAAMRDVQPGSSVTVLRATAFPYLRQLMELTEETTNLQIRVDDQVRFVATAECRQVLRVGDREGRLLPAHLVSGGKALLARLRPDEVRALYAGARGVDVEALLRELRSVRRRGFAINNQATEAGVVAVGRAVDGPDGTAVAAVSVAMPSARFSRARLHEWSAALAHTAAQIEAALAEQ
jgi:IclR family transcriptional regulator, acetate operon repressor